MAAVAITAPSRRNRLRRLAVERAMTEVAISAHGRRDGDGRPVRAHAEERRGRLHSRLFPG